MSTLMAFLCAMGRAGVVAASDGKMNAGERCRSPVSGLRFSSPMDAVSKYRDRLETLKSKI